MIKVKCDETLGSVSYTENQGVVTFNAVPGSDAVFLKWGYYYPELLVTHNEEKLVTDDGFFFSANATGETDDYRTTFSLTTDNVSAFAYFKHLNIETGGRGTVQTVKNNNTVKFTAIADENYMFRKFIINNNGVITEYSNHEVTITVQGDVSVTAEFFFTLEWIPTIRDRTQEDINNKTDKAYMNYTDFNRIEQDIAILQNYYGFDFNIKIDWDRDDYPKQADFTRILSNLTVLRTISGLRLDPVPSEPINHFEKVNTIETILQTIYDSITN